jgi:hypothetical protein
MLGEILSRAISPPQVGFSPNFVLYPFFFVSSLHVSSQDTSFVFTRPCDLVYHTIRDRRISRRQTRTWLTHLPECVSVSADPRGAIARSLIMRTETLPPMAHQAVNIPRRQGQRNSLSVVRRCWWLSVSRPITWGLVGAVAQLRSNKSVLFKTSTGANE